MGMYRKMMMPALQGWPLCRCEECRSGTVSKKNVRMCLGDERRRTMGNARERLDSAEEEERD